MARPSWSSGQIGLSYADTFTVILRAQLGSYSDALYRAPHCIDWRQLNLAFAEIEGARARHAQLFGLRETAGRPTLPTIYRCNWVNGTFTPPRRLFSLAVRLANMSLQPDAGPTGDVLICQFNRPPGVWATEVNPVGLPLRLDDPDASLATPQGRRQQNVIYV